MKRLTHPLASLPPLDEGALFRDLHRCKICAGAAVVFDRLDFNKFCDVNDYYRYGLSGVDLTYLRCLSCGFLFTEDMDDWRAEDFAQFVYNSDYVKIDPEYVKVRPEQLAYGFSQRFRGCENARILDYGSGAGVFVDRMRQHGFMSIEAYDPFSSPARPVGRFDIITCFEVIEHSPNPVDTLTDMKSFLREDGCVIFSQTLQPPDILSLRGNWWYIAPRNGHVSTYTEEALVELGRQLGLAFHRGQNIFGFASPWPSSFTRVALQCAGPSFGLLRLLAPTEVASRAILSPQSGDALWHPVEDDGIWRYRRTGLSDIVWDARWQPVSVLQIRLPVTLQSDADFAARCSIELNWQRKPLHFDRGEFVAEFEVAGVASGQIVLRMPDRASDPEASAAAPDAQGLAILVSQTPLPNAGRARLADPSAYRAT